VEWHSVGHQVTIIEKGVLYRGKRYRSMSEVARLITGARWSGPRFLPCGKGGRFLIPARERRDR
jgi:hypothetical protein